MLDLRAPGVGVASELRSVVSSLRDEVLAELPDARVEQDFTELHEAVEALEAERLRRLAEIDRRRIYERDGHLSVASWLAGRFRVGWGQARSSVLLARGMDQMSVVRRAFEAGRVSLSAVRVLAESREAEPEAFGKAEPLLTEAASRHPISDLRRTVVHWRHLVESERAGEIGYAEILRARRRLHASVTLEGMVRLDGDLDPETGETFMTALRAVLTQMHARGSQREPPDQSRRSGRPLNAVLTRSQRSAVAGSIVQTVRWWPGSALT